MVLKKSVFIVLFLGLFFSCSKHFEYEYVNKENISFYDSINRYNIDHISVSYSISFYDRTDDVNYEGSTEAKANFFNVSLYDQIKSNHIFNTNDVYELLNLSLETSINGKALESKQSFGNKIMYSSWEYNWNEIPFEDGVTSRVKLNFVLSNVSNAQVYDFSFDEEIICVEHTAIDPL